MVLTVAVGDVFGLTYYANVATNWSATLRVRNQHGVVRKYVYRENAATTTGATSFTSQRIEEDGEIVGFGCATGTVVTPVLKGVFFVNAFILGNSEVGDVEGTVAKGYVYDGHSLGLGDVEEREAWVTWVFQGTVAEDATAGTHVCSLTVTPGAGNEMRILYGQVVQGNTATSQTTLITIDDGTNVLTRIQRASFTSANSTTFFPGAASFTSAGSEPQGTDAMELIVSGTMRLVLSVTTTAVSVTQTFAVVCKVRGILPTATLNDTIGTSTNTTNTNAVF